MTYIELINRFWKIDSQVRFTGNETKLYFAFLKIANELHWKKKQLSIPNGRLLDYVRCSKPTLLEARRKLVKYNLITYTPGRNHNTAPVYTIVMNNDFVIDDTENILPVKKSTGRNNTDKPTDNLTPIKEEDKDKYIIRGNEKKHDGSSGVYKFFHDNFKNSDKIIARVKAGLGNNFTDFMLYLFNKELQGAIINANRPVNFIMHFKNESGEWVKFQRWLTEHYKEGDLLDRYGA